MAWLGGPTVAQRDLRARDSLRQRFLRVNQQRDLAIFGAYNRAAHHPPSQAWGSGRTVASRHIALAHRLDQQADQLTTQLMTTRVSAVASCSKPSVSASA